MKTPHPNLKRFMIYSIIHAFNTNEYDKIFCFNPGIISCLFYNVWMVDIFVTTTSNHSPTFIFLTGQQFMQFKYNLSGFMPSQIWKKSIRPIICCRMKPYVSSINNWWLISQHLSPSLLIRFLWSKREKNYVFPHKTNFGSSWHHTVDEYHWCIAKKKTIWEKSHCQHFWFVCVQFLLTRQRTVRSERPRYR